MPDQATADLDENIQARIIKWMEKSFPDDAEINPDVLSQLVTSVRNYYQNGRYQPHQVDPVQTQLEEAFALFLMEINRKRKRYEAHDLLLELLNVMLHPDREIFVNAVLKTMGRRDAQHLINEIGYRTNPPPQSRMVSDL